MREKASDNSETCRDRVTAKQWFGNRLKGWVDDKGELLLGGRSTGHSALAFFAAVLTLLCRDKVTSTDGVIRATTYRCDLYGPHFRLEWLG